MVREVAKQSEKRYCCLRCKHEKRIVTNHYGSCWSLDRYLTCSNCPPYAKYPEYGGQTVWVCLDEDPNNPKTTN